MPAYQNAYLWSGSYSTASTLIVGAHSRTGVSLSTQGLDKDSDIIKVSSLIKMTFFPPNLGVMPEGNRALFVIFEKDHQNIKPSFRNRSCMLHI